MNPANGNSNPNNRPNAQAWFCPSCGGADVTASALAGGEAKCNICTWTGKVEDLPTFPFSHDGGSPEEILHRLSMELRNTLSKHFGTLIGQLLIKWGFLEQPDPKNADRVGKQLARYLGAATVAILGSIIRTRKEIEKETHGQQPPAT